MKTNEKGLSMIELVLVLLVVSFLVLLISNLPSSVNSINKSRHASLAKDIANKELDYLRRQTYTNLANGTDTFTDTSLNGLPGHDATYTIEDCPATVCTSSEAVKKVNVSISWDESGQTKKVELTTLVAEGGVGQ